MSEQSRDVLLYYDEAMVCHDPGSGHPERPQRLTAIKALLDEKPVAGTRFIKPEPASGEALGRIHQAPYLTRLEGLRGASARLDADTALSPRSVEAATLVAGAGLQAVDALLAGTARRTFVLGRPPGHHAEAERAMGFCLLNNIAIAAAHALERGCERVLIVDWDVHHGNGTQHSFYERRDVLVFNTHQFPFYPGSGSLDEPGAGDGLGFTVNAPLPGGLGDGDYQKIFEDLLTPVAERFEPELILVSAGFDAHRVDPLASMELSVDGFAGLCGVVQGLAERLCGGRLGLFLEGGYDLDALAASARACIEVLAGATPPRAGAASAPGERVLKAARERYSAFWSL